MARVTTVEVKEIYPTASDPLPFITIANILVSEKLAGSGLSDDMLKLIELFLSAHFAVLTLERGGLERERMGDSTQDYKGISIESSGLSVTRFGQQAIALDTTGTLGSLSARAVRARFSVAGDPCITQSTSCEGESC